MSSSIKFIQEEYSWDNQTLSDFLSEGNIPSNWIDFFQRKDIQTIVENISKSIEESRKQTIVYPPPNLVFRTLSLSLSNIKVIILGQDVYHDGNAVGLCFSVPKNKRINPSLNNIYKQLENEEFKVIKNGSLEHWFRQGCLMLNTGLTVEKGNPESHIEYWYDFTDLLLQYISNNTKNVAWILMGKHAASFKKYTGNNGHKSFITSHPSPFSANRPFQLYSAFIGSNIFSKVNSFLGEQKAIKW